MSIAGAPRFAFAGGWPNTAQVEAVSGRFEGAYFDGMIDYKGSRYHKLDGADVHFGADFIFEEREYSDAAIAKAIGKVVRTLRWLRADQR